MSVEIRKFNPDGVPLPAGAAFGRPAFTRVVTAQGPMRLVFLAGVTPNDAEHRPVAEGDYQGQYVAVMESLDTQLKAAGATWQEVVYRRIFTLDVDALIEAIRRPDTPTWEPVDMPPASTMIGVTRLSDPGFLVEIDLLAITDADGA